MRLCDIIETYISGDCSNDEPTEDASCPVSCIRGADIVPIYNSEYDNIPSDTAKTEYVLAGTFLSFGIAILFGLMAGI